jgi:hypothetical protein
MPKVSFTLESSAPPERVLAAATDFSDRRPELWPNSSRWSTPGTVRATVLESNVFTSGTWELRAEPRPGGGSRVSVVNDRQTKGKDTSSAS